MRIWTIAIVCSASAIAGAQLSFNLDARHGTTAGADRWLGSSVPYSGIIENHTGGTVFINSFDFVPTGGDWSELNMQASGLLNNLLGTPFGDGSVFSPFFLDGMFHVGINDESALTTGTRTGSITLRGGADENANDILASSTLTLDVHDGYGGLAGQVLNPVQSIAPGQTTAPFRWRLSNGNLPVWSWVAITYGPADTNVFLTSFGTWPTSSDFNRFLNPGEVWEGDSVEYTAGASAQPGQAEFYLRAMGGLNLGDADFMTRDAHTVVVTPVPEPATIAAMLLGVGALAAKRRKRA